MAESELTDDASVATEEISNPIRELGSLNPGAYKRMRDSSTSVSGTMANSHFDPINGTFAHHLEQDGARSYSSRDIDNDSIPKPLRRRKKKLEKLEPQKKAEDIENYKGDRPIDELISFIGGQNESSKKAKKNSSVLEDIPKITQKSCKKNKDKKQKSPTASGTFKAEEVNGSQTVQSSVLEVQEVTHPKHFIPNNGTNKPVRRPQEKRLVSSRSSNKALVPYKTSTTAAESDTRLRDLSPSAFPALSRGKERQSIQDGRRNFMDDIPIPSELKSQDDSDLESVKSLPATQGSHTLDSILSPRLSYAEIAASSKAPGSVSSSDKRPLHRGECDHEQQRSLWVGGPTERRHSIGSSTEVLKKVTVSPASMTACVKARSQNDMLTNDVSTTEKTDINKPQPSPGNEKYEGECIERDNIFECVKSMLNNSLSVSPNTSADNVVNSVSAPQQQAAAKQQYAYNNDHEMNSSRSVSRNLSSVTNSVLKNESSNDIQNNGSNESNKQESLGFLDNHVEESLDISFGFEIENLVKIGKSESMNSVKTDIYEQKSHESNALSDKEVHIQALDQTPSIELNDGSASDVDHFSNKSFNYHVISNLEIQTTNVTSGDCGALQFAQETDLPSNLSLTEAEASRAKIHGFPIITLRDMIANKNSVDITKSGRNPVLNIDQEERLRSHIKSLAEVDYGYTLSEEKEMISRRVSPSQTWTQPAKDEDGEEEDGFRSGCGLNIDYDEAYEVDNSSPDVNSPRSDPSEPTEMETICDRQRKTDSPPEQLDNVASSEVTNIPDFRKLVPVTPQDLKKKKKKHAKDDPSVAMDENGNPIVESRSLNPGVNKQMRDSPTSGSGRVANSHFDASYGTFSHHLEKYGARSYSSRDIDNDSIPKPLRRRKKKLEKLEPQKKAEDIENYKGDRPIDELISYITGPYKSNVKAKRKFSFLEDSLSKTEKLNKKKKDIKQKAPTASNTVLPTENFTKKKEDEMAKGKDARKQTDHRDLSRRLSVPDNSETSNEDSNVGLIQKSSTEEIISSRCKGLSLTYRRKQRSNRPPKETCIYDGRLILLSDKDRVEIKKTCTSRNEIGKGGFGTVYKQNNAGLGITVAIKKVKAFSEEMKNSARREMYASRILHPFILPLLATFEEHSGSKSVIYFISPYCENRDLYRILKECRDTNNPDAVRLSQTQRMRIILQVALAIQYLHTPVQNVREILIHKDISSANIVLDENYNARLIDFGLAREIDDKTSRASGRIHYLHPKIGQPGCLASVIWDIYSFGVVILELLTGLDPSGKDGIHLKYMPDIIKHLASVWPANDEDSQTRAALLVDVAAKCLSAKEGMFSMKCDVIDKVQSVLRQSIMNLPQKETKKCEYCMINPDSSEAKRMVKHLPNCKDSIRLCIACERNSFLNPVSCYSCGAKMVPMIGDGWGALLVAGNDTDDGNNAKIFKDDTENVNRIITSRAPLVMGIRKENVQLVAMENPGSIENEEKLLPLVKNAIQELSKANIHTLVVYFSCHGEKNNENSFQLASKEEKLSISDFQDMLSSLTTVRKVIIILDRCFADKITVKDKTIVQINASKSSESAPVQSVGSPFTKYLIQGLKARSEGETCDIVLCCYCKNYWATRNDYITVGSLMEYIGGHMMLKNHPEPYCYFEGNANSLRLAYYTEEEVFIDFTEDGELKQTVKQLPMAFCETMDELKTQLLSIFKSNRKEDFDVIIQSDTFRKDAKFVNCENIADVRMAWYLRKPLRVKFIKKIQNNSYPGEEMT